MGHHHTYRLRASCPTTIIYLRGPGAPALSWDGGDALVDSAEPLDTGGFLQLYNASSPSGPWHNDLILPWEPEVEFELDTSYNGLYLACAEIGGPMYGGRTSEKSNIVGPWTVP